MSFKMKYPIKEMLIPYKSKRRPSNIIKPTFIVCHDTGNVNTTAKSNAQWMINTAKTVPDKEISSAHLFIDWNEILMTIPCFENPERAYHVMSAPTYDNIMFGDDANDIAIGVELAFADGKVTSLKAYEKYVWVIAYLIYFHKMDINKCLVSHKQLDPKRKSDPDNALKRFGKSFEILVEDVKKEYYSCIEERDDDEVDKIKTVINGKEYDAFIKDGTAFIPAKFLRDLGLLVDWDEKTRKVIIRK